MLSIRARRAAEQVPDGVAYDVTLLGRDGELRGAGKEEIRFGLCPLDITALDHDRFRTEAERLERCVDLWPPPRGRDPEWHSRLPIRRWIRQPSIGRPASASARCQANTWA
jgi:hypothetical protein